VANLLLPILATQAASAHAFLAIDVENGPGINAESL
jgi:hypothetical protein